MTCPMRPSGTLLERSILRTLGESPKTTAEILVALRLSRRTSLRVVATICLRLRADGVLDRVTGDRNGRHLWELRD